MKDYIVVTFSGGKDSTALVLRMIELGEHIDEVLCCDTYKEFPAMYRHIDRVKEVIEKNGIKFTLLRSEKSFDYYLYEHKAKRRNKALTEKSGFSWAGPLSRWCTTLLKINVMNNYLAELRSKHNIVQCIGIAKDEQQRLEKQYSQDGGFRFPLSEWGWTEDDCLKYCYEKGYDWEGLYKLFRRVSCWCCPLQPLSELRVLRKEFPELWEELKYMDSKTFRKFKSGWSVENLEKRFAFEDERTAAGLSITNREFHKELKKRLEVDK